MCLVNVLFLKRIYAHFESRYWFHLLVSNSNRTIQLPYICLTVSGTLIYRAGAKSLRCYAKFGEVVKGIVELVDRIIVRYAMWFLFAS